MSAPQLYEFGAVVLGYVGNVATWRRSNPDHPDSKRYVYNQMVTIQLCSSTDEGVHIPAESVTLTGRAALLALRTAIDEALKEGVAP